MNILITGISGFVGFHLVNELKQNYPDAKIWGIDIEEPNQSIIKSENFKFVKLDLADSIAVEKFLEKNEFYWIFHLAAFSSVAKSWADPVGCFQNNTNIFLNLLDAVRKLGQKTRILSVGSSEEYGVILPEETPILEERNLSPINPYAVARVSQEMLSKIYSDSFGVEIVLTRSFNHMGPGQRPIFFIPSIAKQLMDLKSQGKEKGTIKVGKINIIRDYLDVRDVVKAYTQLIHCGNPGEIYNVCSGKGNELSFFLKEMIRISNLEIEIKVDEKLIRPKDNPIIIGSNEKLRKHTNWLPEISIEKSLSDVLESFRDKK